MKQIHSRIKELKSSDIFEHASSLGYLPRWVVLFLDLGLCVAAFYLALLLDNGLFSNASAAPRSIPLWSQLLILMTIQSIMFWMFHTYSGILRYSTFIDTIKAMMSIIAAGTVYIIINYIALAITGQKPFYTSQAFIYMLIAFVGMFSLRVGTKTLFELAQSTVGQKVMIYGTQSAGIAIAKMLRTSVKAPYTPVGFICDKDESCDYDLVGLHIRRLDDRLIPYMKAHNINNVIVSPLKLKDINPAQDLNIFLENNIRILTTPFFTDWATTTTTTTTTEELAAIIGRIESIHVEDLLERPTIKINCDNVRQIIDNKVVLVSGAAGSIGSELVRQITKYNPQVIILLEQVESPLHDFTLDLKQDFPNARFIPLIGDVRNRERIETIFKDFRPDVVFHAAAYKHVPLMEEHPNEAVQANVMGTKNMADMAVKYGVERFVMISTDKAVNPTNIMGASKRIAEIYVQSLFKKLVKENPNCTKFITTRFGNVLGSNGSVIPYFKKQIAAGGPVTVTHPDIIRYFMTIPEACTLVMEAATLGNGGEIFVFDMGHPVKIADLAKNMIRLSGYEPGKDIQIVYTGLRPGEKLYEELLNQKETTLPTTNEKIMVARVREYDFDTVLREIDQLIAISHEDKVFSTVQQMKHIVPEFISKNSVYEQLDTLQETDKTTPIAGSATA